VHLPITVRQLGNNVAHHSHSLYYYRGLHFCINCGGTGAYKFHKLAIKCIPIPANDKTSRGAVTVDRLSKGKLPSMMKEWPDQKLQKSELKTLSDFQQELSATEHILNVTHQLQATNAPIAVPPPPNSLGQFSYADSDSESQSNPPLNKGLYKNCPANQLLVGTPPPPPQ